MARIGAQLAKSLPEVVGTPCLGISALTGEGAEQVMPTVMQAYQVWNQRVPTARLNRWLVKVRLPLPMGSWHTHHLRLRQHGT